MTTSSPVMEPFHLIASDQQPLLFAGHSQLRQDAFPISCNGGIDSYNRCILPICSVIPAAIAVVIFILWLLKPLSRYRPLWMKPFVNELKDRGEDNQKDGKKPYTRSKILLLLTLLLGLTSQIIAAIYPFPSVAKLLPVLSWVRCPRISRLC